MALPMQAKLKESPASSGKDKEVIPTLNSIAHKIMRKTCSNSSVKLMAKNLFCPHIAPRKIEYKLLEISAGKSRKSIVEDILLLNKAVMAFGIIKITSVTIMVIAKEIHNPAPTTLYSPSKSLSARLLATERETTKGKPLQMKVSKTPKTLIAT